MEIWRAFLEALSKGYFFVVAQWKESPFEVIALGIFAIAVVHTFLSGWIARWAARLEERTVSGAASGRSHVVELLRFAGEVEIIFGLWAIPLFLLMVYFHNWDTAVTYYSTRNYTEPLFIAVIMTLAATRPILQIVKWGLARIAHLGGSTVGAWWLSILLIGPCFGSLITEPAAMTISALLLSQQFYRYGPSPHLAYATLALLFANVSVGGVFTNFAAPPVLIVASKWGWSSWFMIKTFAWRVLIGMVLSCCCYYLFFRREFSRLQQKKERLFTEATKDFSLAPSWVTAVHMAVLVWTVASAHYPVLFLGGFILFLGFYQATRSYQDEMSLRGPILVGFFFSGLILHGGFQQWWLEPLLEGFSSHTMLGAASILTAFNDNAAITYMTSLIPHLSDELKIAVVAGAISGGGLTVIANAPNPAGQQILGHYFKDQISPLRLLIFAVFPALLFLSLFAFL